MKYKVTADGREYYGHPDLSIAAGGYDTYTGPTATMNCENPSNVTKIELAFGCTVASGTITVEAKLIGTDSVGGDMGTTELSAMSVDEGSAEYFTVSGNKVTVLKAAAEGDYKSVYFDVENWDKAKAGNVMITVKNSLGKALTIKYKVATDAGIGWGYPDMEIAAGATESTTFKTTTNDKTSATEVTKIELFIILLGWR